MKLTALYARVSTAKQEEEQTVKTQLVADTEEIAKRGLILVTEYVDEGWSGDILARPALDRLRQDAKKKLWQVLVVYDPDRLARRYSYQELIMDELKEAGIEIIFVTVSAPQNSEEKILHGVRGLFAEYERAKIGERFRLGKLRKVKEGHLLLSKPCYGYRYIPKNEKVHGYYEINEEEARIVRMIFDWVGKENLTLRAIVRKLQGLGIRPRKNKNGVWATSTLSTLLRNKTYIGEAHWGKSYAVAPEKPKNELKYKKNRKTSRRMKPEDQWYKIKVPDIVEPALFYRVQKTLKSNFLLAWRNKKNEYLLAGKIYCPCGCRRSGEGVYRGKHLYYRCIDRVLSFPLPHRCNEKAVNARIFDKLVWDRISCLMTSPELMEKQIQIWINSQHKISDSNEADIEFIRKEIAKLKNQEERYNKAYGGGLLTLEQLREYAVPVREKMVMYQSQLSQSEQAKGDSKTVCLPTAEEISAFACDVSKNLEDLDFQAKRGIILKVVEKVVATNQKLQIYGFIPITNVEMCSNDRYSQRASRHRANERNEKLLPFNFTISSFKVDKNINISRPTSV